MWEKQQLSEWKKAIEDVPKEQTEEYEFTDFETITLLHLTIAEGEVSSKNRNQATGLVSKRQDFITQHSLGSTSCSFNTQKIWKLQLSQLSWVFSGNQVQKRKKSKVDSLRNATMWAPALPLPSPRSRSHSPPPPLAAAIFLLSSRQDNYRLSNSEASISHLTAFYAFVLAIRNCCECQGLYYKNVVWFFAILFGGTFCTTKICSMCDKLRNKDSIVL